MYRIFGVDYKNIEEIFGIEYIRGDLHRRITGFSDESNEKGSLVEYTVLKDGRLYDRRRWSDPRAFSEWSNNGKLKFIGFHYDPRKEVRKKFLELKF